MGAWVLINDRWYKSLEDILQPSFYQDFIPAAHRFGVAGAAGSAAGADVGGIIAQKVTAKMLGKSVIKLAGSCPAEWCKSVALYAAPGG